MKREHRLLSHRTPSQSKSTHIVEDNLNRKSQLLEKYQTQIQESLEQMDSKPGKHNTQPASERRSLQRSRVGSQRKQTIPYDGNPSTGGLNDYQKLILGLQYALEAERKKRESLQSRNMSLETQISNLRNLLVGPDEQKHYEKTVFKEYQEKINSLQGKILDQKKNYEFIIDSKNEGLASLEFQLRTLEKKVRDEEKDSGASRKILELMGEIDELRTTLTKKNILIERLRFHKEQAEDSQSDDEKSKKMRTAQKLQFYSDQLQISNKLILRKNIQILNLNKKTLKYEQVLDVIEQYLDKKEVKNVDLNVLEHACVNKLRLLLREKAVFERELLTQLNQHNKKISSFEQEIVQRDNVNGGKIVEVINDNKRLTALVSTLQNNIRNLEKTIDQERRESEIQRNQVEINKKQFVEEVKRMKEELNTISSVTKNEFDRMKIENLKLSEQNRSLLFLVGEKQKEIHKKGEAIRTFEDYKDKINNLDVGAPQKRKIDNSSEQVPQIGSKLLLVNNFSGWMVEWNKVRNWNNKKVLLNLILDKEEIREDSLKSITYLVNVIHEAILSSKNADIQERATILLSYYLKHDILKNVGLFVDKISPIIVRGFRPGLQGEDGERLRLLNQSALKIVSAMELAEMRWSQQMTNEMLAVNGLKYLFNLISNSQVDELVEAAYNSLIMIARQNEMISFMNSYNITSLLIGFAKADYPFLIFALHLLRCLLRSRDYLKSQKSLLDFRRLFYILKDDDDPQTVDLTLDCCLLLMDNSLFVKSINKIETLSILAQSMRSLNDYPILKKVGQTYGIIVTQMETENMPKMPREVDKLVDIINSKKFSENRFGRALRMILQIASVLTDSADLDEKIITGVNFLYGHYDNLESKTRIKLNSIINTIYQRNKEVINKYSNEDLIVNLVEAYKMSTVGEELVFLLKILLFQHQQKRTTEILRAGREALIGKHINDALLPDYSIAQPSLKNLLAISKEKYAEKFANKALFAKIIGKILASRSEEDYLGTAVSILYFFCKNEDVSGTVIECGLVERIFSLITQRHDKQGLVYKCLTLLELCHTSNYKRKILNHLLSSDSNLQILKTINFILRKAKNKQEMGTRAVFIYDFLNGKTAVESMALLVEQNAWMVEDLIQVRNEYVGKVDSLVYKIELLLHNMSSNNAKVRQVYEKFKIAGDYDSEDDK